MLLPVLLQRATVEPKIVHPAVVRDGLEMGLWMALGYGVQAVALTTSPASLQAFLLSLTVVVCCCLLP